MGARAADRRAEGRGDLDRRDDALPVLRRARHPRARRGPHRAVLRAPRQAAGDDGLARRPRALEAGDRGRQAVRPRRRRRRLRAVRRADRDPGPRRAQGRAPALRRPDRDLRGERQPRPARLPREARPAPGAGAAGRRPRLGLRQLRAAVGDDLAARAGRRGADGRGAAGGRALGLGERARALVVPHRPQAAEPPRRRRHRSADPGRAARTDPAGAHRAGEGRGRDPRRRRLEAVPVGRLQPRARRPRARDADDHRPGRGDPGPHLAARAVGDRRRAPAGHRVGRQRAASEDLAEAVAAAAADGRRRSRRGAGEARARGRSALQREGELLRRARRDRLERPTDRALAQGGGRARRTAGRRSRFSGEGRPSRRGRLGRGGRDAPPCRARARDPATRPGVRP